MHEPKAFALLQRPLAIDGPLPVLLSYLRASLTFHFLLRILRSYSHSHSPRARSLSEESMGLEVSNVENWQGCSAGLAVRLMDVDGWGSMWRAVEGVGGLAVGCAD